MSEKLNRTAKEALESATASLRVLAEEAGLHKVTLAKWRLGMLGVGPDSARKLAEALERRGLRLLELAGRLRARAELEQEGGDE